MKLGRAGSKWRSIWLAPLFIGLISSAGAASAQQSVVSAGPTELPYVRVRVVGALGRDPVLKQRIASWFERGRFVISVESASYLEPEQVLAPNRGSRVEAWITQRSDKQARLYFASVDPETRKPKYLLRDLTLEAGLDEVGAEELAEAVHLSTLALLEGQATSTREQVEASLHHEPEAPTSRAESTTSSRVLLAGHDESRAPHVAAASPPQVATPPPRDRALKRASRDFTIAGALGYAVDYRGDEGWAHGPRARLRLAHGSWGGFARLGFVVPHERELSSLRLSLTGGAGFIGASYRRQVAKIFALEGFAAAGLALVRYAPSPRPDVDFEPGPAATELRPQLSLGAIFAIGSSPRVALIPELAIALGTTHYEVERGGKRKAVARASRLQPGLALELEL